MGLLHSAHPDNWSKQERRTLILQNSMSQAFNLALLPLLERCCANMEERQLSFDWLQAKGSKKLLSVYGIVHCASLNEFGLYSLHLSF